MLTVFEVLNAEQLPYYLELTAHLKAKGLAVSAPCRLIDGRLMTQLHGKPAALAQCLAGSDVMPPQVTDCAQVGGLLAQMHLATEDFPLHQSNLRSLAWWQATVPTLYPHVNPDLAALLADELQARGFRLITGGTSNHLILADVYTSFGIDGHEAETAMDAIGLTLNKNAIPDDTLPRFRPSGIRLGTPALTTRGLREEHMSKIAEWMKQAIELRDDTAGLEKLRDEVRDFVRDFPLPY